MRIWLNRPKGKVGKVKFRLLFNRRQLSLRLFDNFVFILAWGLPMMVLMVWQKMDFIESLQVILQGSKGHKRVKLWYFCNFFGNFLKYNLITFLKYLHAASWGRCWSTVKIWFWLHYSKGHFQGRKVRCGPFSNNYRYDLVITKCHPNVLLLCCEANTVQKYEINVWNHSKGH